MTTSQDPGTRARWSEIDAALEALGGIAGLPNTIALVAGMIGAEVPPAWLEAVGTQAAAGGTVTITLETSEGRWSITIAP